MSDFEFPKINFEPLPNNSEEALFERILSHQTARCFLVYMRYKYSFEEKWEYSTECCCLYNYDDILWFNDWYEGQQDVEYLGVAVIDDDLDFNKWKNY